MSSEVESARCPECRAVVAVPGEVIVTEIVDCDGCAAELEVIARVAQYVGDLTAVMPASTPITVVVDVAPDHSDAVRHTHRLTCVSCTRPTRVLNTC
ncbi:hypothetical protein ACFQ1S_17780 [Kibdelosporangium lantanae]|uniref:Uncharacterized protein n=1 Tax=Kibdelosporangium lantanae TaxID=1497396 RepID=A0ABW3MCE2_9PSEU